MPNLPPELWILLAVGGLSLLVGVPVIRATIHLPAALETESVRDEDLEPRQRKHFGALDRTLAAVQYRPLLNCRANNLQGANLMRVYVNDALPAVICAAALRSHETAGMSMTQTYVEVITELEDGTTVYTRNPQTGDLFDPMPQRHIKDYPAISDPLQLLARHEQRVAAVQQSAPRFPHGRDVLAEFRDYHSRWCAYQQERGLLRFDPTGQVFRPTTRLALRGVANFFNPLADNFTWPRFLAGTVLGLLLPALAVVVTAAPELPLPEWITPLQALIPLTGAARVGFVALAFALAGAGVGYTFTSKAFVWGLLLGLLPMRLLALDLGAWSWILLLVMGTVADRVAAWRHEHEALV